MSLAEDMEAARRRVVAETDIAIPKDDTLLVVYALLLDAVRQNPPSSGSPDLDREAAQELALTAGKIREMRENAYKLTDAVIAGMAERSAELAPPPEPAEPAGPDWIARVLAGIAAVAAVATLVIVATKV